MITESKRKKMVSYLRDLGNGWKPYDDSWGICGNFKYRFGDSIKEVFKNYYATVQQYKKFSGHLVYPVPAPAPEKSNFFSHNQAYRSSKKWEGDYGDERREFARYLADQLEKEDNKNE